MIKKFIPAPPGYRAVYVSWQENENGTFDYEPYSLPIVAFGIDEDEEDDESTPCLEAMVMDSEGYIESKFEQSQALNVSFFRVLEPGQTLTNDFCAEAIKDAESSRLRREALKKSKREPK